MRCTKLAVFSFFGYKFLSSMWGYVGVCSFVGWDGK